MQRAAFAPLVLSLVILSTLGCGPMGPLPGGELSGTPTPAPADWSTDPGAAKDTVQLETRPSDPYSINVWGIGLPSGYYVAAGRGEDSSWAQYMIDEPEVRLVIDEKLYELRAVRVTDRAELNRFAKALEAKYDFEVTPEQKDEAWIFRLDPR